MFEFTWNVDPELINLGPIVVRYYGVLFVLMLLGGFYLFRWQVTRAGASQKDAQDILVTGVISVLVGSRVGHVLFYDFDHFLQDPLWLFQFWKGGLSSHGATIGIVLGLWVYARRHRQSLVECMDRFTFAAALAATVVRIGNFVNSEIVGRLTDQTWGVRFPLYDTVGIAPLRHPSQLYEVGLGLFVMAVLFAVDRLLGREKRPRGVLISTFFLVYFGGRFFVEFFKEYQVESIEAAVGLNMGQLLSIPIFLLGIVGMIYSLRKKQPATWNLVAETVPAAASGHSARRSRHARKSKKSH